MKPILSALNTPKLDSNRIPTLIVAMPDMAFGEMISEWQFNCHFRPIAVLDTDSSIFNRIRGLKPDFIFIDAEISNCNGFELAEKIHRQNLHTRIIMYASSRVSEYLSKFLSPSNQNVQGFLHKGCGIQEIERCMIEVFAGRRYISSNINENLHFGEKSNQGDKLDYEKLNSLSNRQKDVWNLLAEGKTEQEIADTLFIGITTVKSHKKTIREVLGIIGKGKLIYLAITSKVKLKKSS